MKTRLGGRWNPDSQRISSLASAWADSIGRSVTSAATEIHWPWIFISRAPSSIARPRVPAAWKPEKTMVFLRSGANALRRSEEHTSELQSLMRSSYAVFCLKKKKTHISNPVTHYHTVCTPLITNTTHE